MDQDDSMNTSPSSHGNDDTYDEDNLFPEDTNNPAYVAAQTPQNDHLNAALPGELSPPRSQTNTSTGANGFDAASGAGVIGVDEDDLTDDDEAIDLKGDRARLGQDDKNKPGAGWKNKKSQEEMQRSWEFIVDKDFDIKQFGDPLAGKQR